MKVIELGCPGHLIVARYCNWRRHTQVGNFRVSTLGDYYRSDKAERQTVGSGAADFFETMVFRTSGKLDGGSEQCGCREVVDWSGLECRRYATAGEAQAGHEATVKKYLAKSRRTK